LNCHPNRANSPKSDLSPPQVQTRMNRQSRTTRRTILAVGCLLALAVAVVFGQTVRYDFVNFDDNAYVYNNPHVACGLTQQTVAWAFTTFHSSNWHPLTWLSHSLDCQLYGTQHPGLHHLTNVVLHAAVAILLFLVLWQMTGSLWPSAFVAAVFAVHPLRVESVAWVAERKDLLSGLFFMLTLAAYVHYVRRPFSWGRHLLVIALFALGLMAKPMLVTLPFVLLLLDYWPLRRFTDKPLAASHAPSLRLSVEKLPLLLLAAASCIVTSAAQRPSIAVSECLPLSSRIANALVSYVAYIGQFFYPVDLAAFYPHPRDGLPMWKIAAALLVLAGVSVAAWIGRRRFPFLLVGWLWYLGMLVPVIGLVQVGDQASADRYTYLPGIGLCIALAWGAAAVGQTLLSATSKSEHVTHNNLRLTGYSSIASALALVMLAAIAWQQTTYWRNSTALWVRALTCTTRNATAQYNLGVTLAQRGDTATAIRCFQNALAIQPRSADAENDLGVVLAMSGRLDEAVPHFQAALRIRPDLADAHNNLRMAKQQQDRFRHLSSP
jgi:protein O-mannosyl-transferase